MRHTVDGQQERERPNLLLSSNRNSIPTIDILSSLENRQNLKNRNTLSRKKKRGLVLLIALVIGITCYLQFSQLQNVIQNSKWKFDGFHTNSNATNPGREIAANTTRLPLAKESNNLAAPTTSIVDDVKTTLESTAVLVDVPIEKDKTEPLGKTSNLTKPGSVTKTIAPLPKASTKKNPPKGGDALSTKNKETQKARANAEKIDAKAYDSDIVLLSALVANTSKSKEQTSINTKHSSNEKKTVTPAINLDVVERSPGDNTKSLLSRCAKLGGAEAKLCHDRICSGSWQSESMCSPLKG